MQRRHLSVRAVAVAITMASPGGGGDGDEENGSEGGSGLNGAQRRQEMHGIDRHGVQQGQRPRRPRQQQGQRRRR